MLADVPDAHDQVRGDLVLHLEIPILNHSGLPVARRDVIGIAKGECKQRRVFGVAGRRIGWERSERARWCELIGALELRAGSRSAAEAAAEIGVAERSIIDAIGAAEDGIGDAVRRVGKPETWTKGLVVGLGARGT